MAFSLRRAMSGLGEAAADIGKDWFGTEIRKNAATYLEGVRAKVQEDRDARIAERREQADIRAEDRKRTQAVAVGSEAEAARTGKVDDLSGTARPRTALEGAEAEAGVYRKHGLIESAMRVQDNERSRQERGEARLDARSDWNADNERADKQLDIAMQNATRLNELTNAQIAHLKGGKVSLPNVKVETLERDGVKTIVNVDQNSGAIGVVTPGEPATPGESNWFSPDKPAKPAGQPSVTWSLNGRVLPGGLSDLYPAMKARIGDQGGTGGGDASASQPSAEHVAGLRARKNDPAAIAAFDKQYGSGAASKYLPAPAQKKAIVDPFSGPAVGTVAKGFRFAGGDPNDRGNWEPASGAGAALDAARAAKRSAIDRLQSYGLVQQKRDPTGFSAARQAIQKAEADVAEAEEAWQRSIGPTGAARFVSNP